MTTRFLALLLLFSYLPALLIDNAMAADHRIENVSGNVYSVVNDRHRSVFAVTEAGIIATDPMDEVAAEWLKRELERRFDKPIRYVIYSHNHSDHVYGARIFETPGVDFIAYELARPDLAYLEALYAAVVDAIHRGISLEEMQEEIRLDDYKHFANYEQWLTLNVEGVYERLMEESGMGSRPDLRGK